MEAKSSSLEASELAISAPILAMPSGPCSPAGFSALAPVRLAATSPSPETTALSPSTTSAAAVRAARSGGSCMREREATWAESSMPRMLLPPRDEASPLSPAVRGCGPGGAMGSRSRTPARSTVAVKGRCAAVAAPMLREAACSGSGWASNTRPSMATSTSALCSPAAAAVLPSSTRDTARGELRVSEGTPTVAADVKRHAQASTRFAMTPALITAACCRGGRFSRRSGSSGSVASAPSCGTGGVIPRSVNLVVLRYRGKLTKPPIGSSRSTYRTAPPGGLV